MAHAPPQAPWMLCVIELVALLLLLLLLLLPRHPPDSRFEFHNSVEDVAVFGCLRDAIIAGCYAYGSAAMNLRCAACPCPRLGNPVPVAM